MASKDWEIIYPKARNGLTPTYRNKKTYQYIQIGEKQSGSFGNYDKKRYPFKVGNGGVYGMTYKKWFNTPREARIYIKHYMRTH